MCDKSGFGIRLEGGPVDLYKKNIGFCRGCRVCLERGSCVQEDDIQEIAGLLKQCNAVVLAAPVYWASVPGAVKNMFDRLLGTAMEETAAFPRPRLSHSQSYVLLTACNTPAPFAWMFGQSRGALRNMSEFFRTSGMSCKAKSHAPIPGEKRNCPGPRSDGWSGV